MFNQYYTSSFFEPIYRKNILKNIVSTDKYENNAIIHYLLYSCDNALSIKSGRFGFTLPKKHGPLHNTHQLNLFASLVSNLKIQNRMIMVINPANMDVIRQPILCLCKMTA